MHLGMNTCFLTSLLTAKMVKAQDASNNSFMNEQEPLKESLVEIWSEELIGIGDMKGKQYIFTSTNVISGHMKLQFKTLSGKQLQPSKIELSATRNLARIQVSKETALKLAPGITVDDAVTVLEYHTSVIKDHSGVITGSSKDMIELSANCWKEK